MSLDAAAAVGVYHIFILDSCCCFCSITHVFKLIFLGGDFLFVHGEHMRRNRHQAMRGLQLL